MAKHIGRSDPVHVLILAEGITSRAAIEQGERNRELTQLHHAAQIANEILGVASLDLQGLPDNRLDGVQRLDIIRVIEKKLDQIKPTIVYTHFPGDLNVDHRRTSEAVVTACRPIPGSRIHTLLFFEVPSSTEWQVPPNGRPFQPTWFVDISATLTKKIEALSSYEMELRSWPHARSIEAVEHLARWRGATVGCEAAEAFVAGRIIR